MFEFKEWPKIPRGQNETVTITEKIDGTNAAIVISEEGEFLGCQSRNRIITPSSDNYGFAQWAYDHAKELSGLGAGYHYGEWAGPGIQGNPHKFDKKRFFLFNTARWSNNPECPLCCDVVPVLFEGSSDVQEAEPEYALEELAEDAAEKDYEPEGIVVWYHKTRRYEKYTFKNTNGKWAT